MTTNDRLSKQLARLLKDIGVSRSCISDVTGMSISCVTALLNPNADRPISRYDKMLEPFGMRLEIVPFRKIPYRTKKELVALIKGEMQPDNIVDHLFLREYRTKKNYSTRKKCIEKYMHYDGVSTRK